MLYDKPKITIDLKEYEDLKKAAQQNALWKPRDETFMKAEGGETRH